MSQTSQAELDDISLRASEYLPVTLDEAVALVRSVTRRCKGSIKLGKEAEYAEMRAAVGMTGGQEKGYDLGAMDAVLRNQCGYDVTEQIIKYPFDGQEHFVECPKCKNAWSFRSPVFVIG